MNTIKKAIETVEYDLAIKRVKGMLHSPKLLTEGRNNMTTTEIVNKLRHKNSLEFFDKKEKLFTRIQINKTETKFVCWQRFVSKDRINWRNWNDFLRLKDILEIRQQIIDNNILTK